MIKIKARSGESIHQMMKRFKKMCEKEGLIKDINDLNKALFFGFFQFKILLVVAEVGNLVAGL